MNFQFVIIYLSIDCLKFLNKTRYRGLPNVKIPKNVCPNDDGQGTKFSMKHHTNTNK